MLPALIDLELSQLMPLLLVLLLTLATTTLSTSPYVQPLILVLCRDQLEQEKKGKKRKGKLKSQQDCNFPKHCFFLHWRILFFLEEGELGLNATT